MKRIRLIIGSYQTSETRQKVKQLTKKSVLKGVLRRATAQMAASSKKLLLINGLNHPVRIRMLGGVDEAVRPREFFM